MRLFSSDGTPNMVAVVKTFQHNVSLAYFKDKLCITITT